MFIQLCQCLLVAPVFAAEPQIVFSLLAASKDTERALGKPWVLCDQ